MALLVLTLGLPACGPQFTYPAKSVPEAIERIARDEYQIATEVRVVGSTVGAVIYVKSLVDSTGQVPKDLHEKMGKVMQVVTRVALSTDLPLDYCTVYLRDMAQGNELVITRSIDDIKRANAEAIGIEESLNRTLFGQAKYTPATEGRTQFVLKEVKQPTFLAEQIVQRIRFNFSKELKDDDAPHPFLLADGNFSEADGKRAFRFSLLALKTDEPKETMLKIFKIANDVLKGYQYTAFEELEIQDYLNRQKLVVDKDTLVAYWKNKIKDQEILEKFLIESSSIQEAFKLFGFSAPQDLAPSP